MIAAKLAAVVLAALASVLVSLAVAAVGHARGVGHRRRGHLAARRRRCSLHAAVLQVTSVLMGVAFGLLLLNTPLAIVGYLLLPTLWSVLGEMVQPLTRAGRLAGHQPDHGAAVHQPT